jgi:hypothetical protein
MIESRRRLASRASAAAALAAVATLFDRIDDISNKEKA